MLNLKQIAIIITQILLCVVGFAQREKIDSLKKALPSLKDSTRIDCLNALSEAYIGLPDWFSSTPTKGQSDTAEIFNLQALEEAKKINYTYGMAKATSLKAELVFEKYNNYSEAEKLSREAILFYKRTANKKGLNRIYWRLGTALQVQSKFKAAINNHDTAYHLSKKAGDSLYVFYAVITSTHVYLASGNYKNAFEKVLNLHRLSMSNNDPTWKAWELQLLGELYCSIEDYTTALKYYQQAIQLIKSDGSRMVPVCVPDYQQLTATFALNKQFDSAKYYYDLAIVDTSNQSALQSYLAFMGEYYFFQKKYDKALPNLIMSLNYNKQDNNVYQVMRLLIDIAKTHLALKNDGLTFKYAHEALTIAQQTGARQFERDCFEILYSVYDRWNRPDSALFYHKKYIAIRDSIIADQVAAKLVAYNFNEKIELLNKEKEVQQTKLQKESFIKKTLIVGILVLLVFASIIFRNIILKRRIEKQRLENELKLQKLESEKTKVEFQQQTTELEMQALRAQMNPHFIFNSLNSINRFILQNDKAKASEYLTKFSRLVRLILQNSQAALIPLESELEALKLYLELEAVRFDNQFKYKVSVDEELDMEVLKVPPLIIQPYAENAIWHGLMHKEEKGHLEIEVYQCDEVLCCKITDDGVGRQKASELKSKSASTHKSMGMRITADRIAMLQQKKQIDTTIKITDLVLPDGSAGGTEVLLKIPVMQ